MATHYFWILVAMMVGISIIHYMTPQIRPLLPNVGILLSRHAVERILFVLPVAAATFAFGQTGGIITLAVAVLIMTPRAIWLSDRPVDAAVETIATGVVGYLVLWMVETEEREKTLRQEAVARMRVFNAMCSIVAQTLELERILNDALDVALEFTSMDTGLIFLLDPQTDELVLSTYRDRTGGIAEAVGRLQLGEQSCVQVAQSGEPMVIEDALEDPRLKRSALRELGLRSQVIVPLESKGKVQGVMALGGEELHEFTSAELQLITTFGKQIGVGVENARLHLDIERQLHIQRQLNEVAERIASELELDKILPKVLQISERLVDADCGFISLYDSTSECLSYPYLHNLPQRLMDVTVDNGMGVAREVMATARPIVVDDYRGHPNPIREFVDAGLVSILAVPIVSGNRSFGTLAVGSLRNPKRFSINDISILSGVGRQAGIAIDNARLYENMRYYARQITRAQEDERKRIAREAHDETAQILVALSRRVDALIASPKLPSGTFKKRLEGVRELTTDALQSVRRFSQDLRPPVLDDLGFVAAVRGLTRNLQEAGVDTALRVSGAPYRLSPEEELVLFRIAQESLNNVRRHADASRAKVLVAFNHSNVHMVIEDNGQGFDAPDKFVDLVASGKLGLIGMHERARILGGTLHIESDVGKGTRVVVDAPVHKRD
ncbi:MAG: GAF domain-containing protein [Anaerolineae bacterium]|jgi:signal transduction histidine kinase